MMNSVAEAKTGGPLVELERIVVETLLSEAANAQYAAGAIAARELRPFAALIRGLSEHYVENQKPAVSPDNAAAYSLYYSFINAAKTFRLLDEIPNFAPRTVLDFGCGPGTASFAAMSRYSDIAITALDSAPAMRALATKLLANAAARRPGVSFEVTASLPERTFDLIILANVLNELPVGEQEPLVESLSARLNPSGVIVILEPALQTATRNLMALRDQIMLKLPSLTPIYPCSRRGPCPMRASSQTDWCHGELSWDPPQLVRQLDELTEFNKHRLKFSALIVRDQADLPDFVRLVGPARKSKRGALGLVCGPLTYGKSTLTDALKRPKSLKLHDTVGREPRA